MSNKRPLVELGTPKPSTAVSRILGRPLEPDRPSTAPTPVVAPEAAVAAPPVPAAAPPAPAPAAAPPTPRAQPKPAAQAANARLTQPRDERLTLTLTRDLYERLEAETYRRRRVQKDRAFSGMSAIICECLDKQLPPR